MTKNLIIIALTLLLSVTTGFGVVAWKMNNELAMQLQQESERSTRIFALWRDSNWLAAEQFHAIECFRKILRRNGIRFHEADGKVIEIAPAGQGPEA